MTDWLENEGPVQMTPAWRFRMLHAAHRAAMDAVLERHGRRGYGHPFVLFLLARGGWDGGLPTQKELSERLRIAPASVTSAVKALERQGCIEREAGADDMRKKRIRITEKGREVARRYVEVFAEVDEAMYAGFTQSELEEVSGCFERITENLRKLAGKEAGA